MVSFDETFINILPGVCFEVLLCPEKVIKIFLKLLLGCFRHIIDIALPSIDIDNLSLLEMHVKRVAGTEVKDQVIFKVGRQDLCVLEVHRLMRSVK